MRLRSSPWLSRLFLLLSGLQGVLEVLNGDYSALGPAPPPSHVDITEVTHKSIKIAWTPPAVPRVAEEVRQYIVSVKQLSAAGEAPTNAEEEGNDGTEANSGEQEQKEAGNPSIFSPRKRGSTSPVDISVLREAMASENGWEERATITADTCEAEIGGLAPRTQYLIGITSGNEFG